MNVSSRTPEGSPHRCPICGRDARLDRCLPLGDTICPGCGSLISAESQTPESFELADIDRPRPLLRLRTSDPSEIYTFSQSKILIGRRLSCHLVLPAKNVSAHHCVIVWFFGEWQVHDLQSTNGTKVNGRRVTSAELRDGDQLIVAKTRVEVDIMATAK
jgi:hypothetical protein